MFAPLIQTPLRTLCWLAFFAAVLLAWAWLYMMADMAGVNVLGQPVGMNMMPMAGFGTLLAMWAVMMAAMMLPTLVPSLRSYEDLMVSANASRGGWLGLIAGYMAVWVGFAALIAGLQVLAVARGLVDHLGVATSTWAAAALLISVGAYQFTWSKQVCHAVCHQPMHYFLGHWRPGALGGARMGAGLGAYCVACCWGYMALGFVGGTMSLAWMGLATLAMVLEKLPQVAHYVIRPLGAALILGGFVVGLRAAGLV